jgi:hypothetical protein
MAALALPLALLLGAVADVAGGLTARGRVWWGPLAVPWDEARRLRRARSRRGRPTAVEALGGVAAAAGGGLAAAGALGLVPGSAGLLYLALVLGVAGLRLVEAAPPPAGARAGGARGLTVVIEVAFVVPLGALLLRWRSFDLDAIRATQTVLGPGVSVAPVAAAASVVLAGLAAAVATALRIVPSTRVAPRRERQARGAATRLLSTIARWSVAGASALVVAALTAGHRLDASPAVLPFAGAAVVAVVLIGIATGVLGRRSPRGRAVVALGALAVAAAAAVLAALA